MRRRVYRVTASWPEWAAIIAFTSVVVAAIVSGAVQP
jgi:hypothetical protein